MIAMSAIGPARDLWEKDTIRIHPIITKGGDAVSVVPAEVRMETLCAGLARGVVDASRKVDRCLRAGQWRWAPKSRSTRSGLYLPQRNDARMGRIFGENVEALADPASSPSAGIAPGRPIWAISPI
jgi:hypothetical protein